MAAFAILAGLVVRSSYRDLAEIAAPDHPAVDGDLLRLRITGGDTSGYAADDVAAADGAVARLTRALDDSATDIRSILASRYPDPAPSETLRVLNLDIAMYRLFGGDAQSERYLVGKRAIERLEGIAAGRLDLEQAQGPTADTAAVAGPDRVFTPDSLFGFTRLGS